MTLTSNRSPDKKKRDTESCAKIKAIQQFRKNGAYRVAR